MTRAEGLLVDIACPRGCGACIWPKTQMRYHTLTNSLPSQSIVAEGFQSSWIPEMSVAAPAENARWPLELLRRCNVMGMATYVS
jgi:hypothetical protein